jgi:hypothetical protein
MNKCLTVAVIAISMGAFGTAYAGGSAGCDFGQSYRSTSVDEDKYSDAEKKLAELSLPIAEDVSTSGDATSNVEPTKADDAPASQEKTTQ